MVALTLYRLATGVAFRTLANQFGVGRSTACTSCYHEVIRAIERVLMPKYIRFPEGEELLRNVEQFKDKGGFPQVVAAIDGSHIPIVKPDLANDQNAMDYFNRKSFYSIVLQACVDASGRFCDTCGYAAEGS
ncbi:uncharacterized protein LOC117118809 [Anneissia japonica]|uniref:uncharacterized protein LOC117118809 n=1 Tax=Anneissia japonica TaxID=1529436 RepID=UPI001425AD36|nr:uncharacterized protein LOC117118809 [Anneissia japonica]